MATCVILVNAFIFGLSPGRRETDLFTDGGPKQRDIKEGAGCLKQRKCSAALPLSSARCRDMQLRQLVLTDTGLALLGLGYFWTQALSRVCWKRTRCRGAVLGPAPAPLWTQTCPLSLAQDYTQGSCARKRAASEFAAKNWITFLPIKMTPTLDQILEILLALK